MEDQFISVSSVRTFVAEAMNHYLKIKAPGWFTDWLDELYVRLWDEPKNVTLYELLTLQRLREDGCWMAQPLAVNMVYKMYDALGRSTAGMLGY